MFHYKYMMFNISLVTGYFFHTKYALLTGTIPARTWRNPSLALSVPPSSGTAAVGILRCPEAVIYKSPGTRVKKRQEPWEYERLAAEPIRRDGSLLVMSYKGQKRTFRGCSCTPTDYV